MGGLEFLLSCFAEARLVACLFELLITFLAAFLATFLVAFLAIFLGTFLGARFLAEGLDLSLGGIPVFFSM